MAGKLFLCVVALFAVFADAYTNVCSVADTAILYDQTFKVFEARLQCEGNSFTTPYCSSYYLNMQKLLRSQLSFKKCAALEAAPYFEYAGNPDAPHGVFYKEQEKLSSYNNATGTNLRQEIDAEFASLIARIEFLWGSIRTNSSEMITAQWSDTRTLDATEEQNNRHTASSEYEQTRDFVTQTENENRDTDGGQNGATRDFDSNSEESTRAFVENQHSETRGEYSAEASNTIANVSSESKSSSDSLTTTVRTEENANHELADDEKASTLSSEATKTQQTLALAQQTSNTTLSLYNTHQTNNNNAWGSLYSTAASMLNAYKLAQNESIDDIITLMIHVDLQNNEWANTWGIIGCNSFGPVDTFTRQTYFSKLRSVVNDTIVYNQAMYGYNAFASTAWYQGEIAKNNGDYRTAATLYSTAYIKAVTPSSWW